MKLTAQVLWPAKAPTSQSIPDDYEPNAVAVTLAVPVDSDRTCGALRNKILRRFTTQAQLQQLKLSDLADKDGALLDLEDTIAELYPEGATSPSDRIVQVKTSWADSASRKRPREVECARDEHAGPQHSASQRKRQRRSSIEGGRGGRAEQSKRTQSRPAVVVIEDSQPQPDGRASPSTSHDHFHTPSQMTPAPGGPASSNPAPTSGQRATASQPQQRGNESPLFVPTDDGESSGLVDLDDEVHRLSDEEGTTRFGRTPRGGSVTSSQAHNVMSSGKVCSYAKLRTDILLMWSGTRSRLLIGFVTFQKSKVISRCKMVRGGRSSRDARHRKGLAYEANPLRAR
jgi:hypothetical protein